MVTHTHIWDAGSKSPMEGAQEAFGGPSVSLRMLPNSASTFLQGLGVSEVRGCRHEDS